MCRLLLLDLLTMLMMPGGFSQVGLLAEMARIVRAWRHCYCDVRCLLTGCVLAPAAPRLLTASSAAHIINMMLPIQK